MEEPQLVTFHHQPSTAGVPLSADAIALCTLNARYIHSSLGLRYLLANMGSLQNHTRLHEFVINQRTADIAEQLLANKPKIIGFGVYIWNINETTDLIALIRKLEPGIKIIIGGPEVSYEYENTTIFKLCDHLITGQADFAFANLCAQLLNQHPIAGKTIVANTPPVKDLMFPYTHYTIEDINNRVLYVEASRGCPFKCEFCLSALDKTAWPFDLDKFLDEVSNLYSRGARRFKFVDRTFNLKIDTCVKILQFFIDRIEQDKNLFLHFEVIPDKLPDALKVLIKQFPPGSLQFEIGIQSFNEDVQKIINRKQNIETSIANLGWLHLHSNAHIHADLIFGLPGETLETFAAGFDQLVALQPDEIQLGLLKRLKGSPIVRQTEKYAMCYSDKAPYQLLHNQDINFQTMQRVLRFSRYWDLIANSGRFKTTLPMLLGNNPFKRFMLWSDWLYENTAQTYKFSYKRLLGLVHTGAIATGISTADTLYESLETDCLMNGDIHLPLWLRNREQVPVKMIRLINPDKPITVEQTNVAAQTPKRQQRHLAQLAKHGLFD